MTLRCTILGCGTSGGVPRIGGLWGACDPSNPRNIRRRCSVLIEKVGAQGTTSVLIDTGPDMRAQLLDANVQRLDGVLYTHSHADHVHGLDDLRQVVFLMKERINVWADEATQADLRSRFGYAFETPEGSEYPPILRMNSIEGPIEIEGPGGRLRFEPLPVNHGRIDALGFRVEGLAYIPDVLDIPSKTLKQLEDLECFVIDTLRYEPHPSHTHLEKTLGWIEALSPKRAVLTNLHLDLDYATLDTQTPAHVTPAYDGMVIEL